MLRLPFVLFLNVFTLLGYALDVVLHRVGRFFQRERRYVQLRLKSNYPLLRAEGLSKHFGDQSSFFEIEEELEELSQDPDVTGLILHIDHMEMSTAMANELGERLLAVRKAGKHVVAHCDMPMTRDFQLAIFAEDVLLTPAGRMYTFAPRFEQYFIAGLLKRLKVGVQFVHLGAFKAATNRFLHERMITSHRLMMEELHDDLTTLGHDWVKAKRGEVDKTWTDHAPVESRLAHSAGLIDGVAFRADIKDWLVTGDDHVQTDTPSEDDESAQAVDIIKWDDYVKGGYPRLKLRPLRRKKRIAVLDLAGMITAPGMKMSSGPTIDPTEVIPVIKRLREDRRVSGVLVHISSPGGSALSSDLIWRALASLRSKKPVVAFCSDVAASGGYYLAVAADEIYCREETLMGSIGVIAGKFSGAKALSPHGINIETIAGDDASTFMSVFSPFPPETLLRLRDDSRAFYRRFLDRVGQSRDISRQRLHRYARGRVYTGRAALKRGLVDGTGGMSEAMERLLTLTEVSREDIEIKTVSHRQQSFGQLARSSVMRMSGVQPLLDSKDAVMLFQREPMLALSLVQPPREN